MKKNRAFLDFLVTISLSGLLIGFYFIVTITIGTITEIGDMIAWYHYLIGLVLFLVFYQISIALHELGHLIFGKLTGYKFLSYRYQSILIKKNENDKLEIKKYKLYGTAGQCLMIPPKEKELPIFWYNFGGVFVNIILVVFSVSIMFLVPNAWIKLIAMIFGFINLFLAFVNWAPFKGLTNDGNNYRSAKKYPLSRKALYYILNTNALLINNKKYSEIEFDININEFDLYEPLQANLALQVALKYLYLNDFSKAKDIFDKVKNSVLDKNNIIGILVLPYIYFLDLYNNKEVAFKTKDQGIEKTFKMMKYEPFFILVKWYEELVLQGVNNDSLAEAFKNACKNNPTPGENEDLINLKNRLLSEYMINERDALN